MPGLRKSEALTPLPLIAFMSCRETTLPFLFPYITRQCEYLRKHRRTTIDVANSSSTQSVLLRYNAASEDNRITDKEKPQLAAKNKRNHDVAEKDMHN